MCLILDADKFGDFLNDNNPDMDPVRNWIHRRNGKLAYAHTEKIRDELAKYQPMEKRIFDYRRAGLLKIVRTADVEKREKELNESNSLSSNDSHIIALALVAGVKLLVSGDKDLHRDFKEIVGGKVYQNKGHKRLLRRDTCP